MKIIRIIIGHIFWPPVDSEDNTAVINWPERETDLSLVCKATLPFPSASS